MKRYKKSTATQITQVVPWLMWSIATLFYAYRYVLDVFPGVAAQPLMQSFHISATELGHLAAIYIFAYTVMQIPIGVLLDRFGTRRLVISAAALTTFGCLIFATTHFFALAMLARLLMGFGAACSIISALYVAATWLPAHRYSLATGLVVMIGMLGAVVGEAPIAFLVSTNGWRHTLLIFTLIGAAITLLLWKYIKDKPVIEELERKTSDFKANLLLGLKTVLKDKQSWLVAIYGCLMFTPTIVFGSLWGVPFIKTALHLSNTDAAFIVSMLFIGWAVGAPLFGWLSEMLRSRKTIMWIGAIGATINLSLAIFCPFLGSLAVATFLTLFGFFSGGFIVAFTVIKELNSSDHTGAATGFMNTLNMIGGILGQPLVGFFLDLFANGSSSSLVHYYSVAEFQWSLAILPVTLLVATLTIIWIKETYPGKN